MDRITERISKELNKPAQLVQNVIGLLDEGNTVPFIARYRKEAHGAMDDTVLRTLEERLRYLRSLEQRREEIRRLIDEQEKLTPELSGEIDRAETLSALEDIYRPYRPKRRTRASIAKEKGLEPLTAAILLQPQKAPEELAKAYVNDEKGVATAEEALAGASDIIAEQVSDSAENRKKLREAITRRGSLRVEAAGTEDSVYRLYYDFSQPVSRLQGHQILAINRGGEGRLPQGVPGSGPGTGPERDLPGDGPAGGAERRLPASGHSGRL